MIARTPRKKQPTPAEQEALDRLIDGEEAPAPAPVQPSKPEKRKGRYGHEIGSKLSLDLDPETHRQLKAAAINEGKKFREYLLDMFYRELGKEIPRD